MVSESNSNKMIELSQISFLIQKTVGRIFLIVFPPFGEDTKLQIDIKLGLVLNEYPVKLITFGTDLEDIWTPVVKEESIPAIYYMGELYEERMGRWMREEIDDEITLEYYDVSSFSVFQNILANRIKKLQLLMIKGNETPFGIKIIFENDYFYTFPNPDGNTIETRFFNKNENLKNFSALGEIIFLPLEEK